MCEKTVKNIVLTLIKNIKGKFSGDKTVYCTNIIYIYKINKQTNKFLTYIILPH